MTGDPGFRAKGSFRSGGGGSDRNRLPGFWGIVKLFFQLEEVWLRSRPKSKIEEALDELVVKNEK